MTLIAFATYGDHAEFITDTASYTANVTRMSHCTKHVTLNHLDAVLLTQGDGTFGRDVAAGALQASQLVATFDELVDTAADWIRQLWRQIPDPQESVVFLLGWSDRASRFVAHGFASDDLAFEPFEIPDLWVMPAPWSIRPSGLELERMKNWMADHPDVTEAARIWQAAKPGVAPRTSEEWVRLAFDAREERSLGGTFARVIVAGKVIHTRVERGAVTTRTVAAFDDSGEEFLKMIAWTLHPLAQAMECHCGSGKRYGDCHLASHLVEPCGCGAPGKTFRDCCMVSAS